MTGRHLNIELVEEFEATLRLIGKLREAVEAEPVSPTKRGGGKLNPAANVLATQQTHLRGLARLLERAKLDLPVVTDDDLSELLD